MAAATKKTRTKPNARDRYAAIQAKKIAEMLAAPIGDDEPLFDFTAPSGMEFKLRKLDITQFGNMGMLPTGLSSKVNMGDAAEAAQSFMQLPQQKQAALIKQSANIVRYVCVSPRIVEDPQGDDEISPDDVTLADFNALAQWGLTGGGASRLGTFR